MKNNYLKTALLVVSIVLSMNQSQAQFGKLINKVAEKTLGTPEGDAKKAFIPNKKEQKMLDEDAADSFLEKQTFKKEGSSGIYYFSAPVGVRSKNTEKIYAVKKVYLEFDDANYKVNLYTRYHFGKTGGEAIEACGWGSSGIDAKARAVLFKQMKSKGLLHYREAAFVDFAYVQYNSQNPTEGVTKGNIKGLLQLEPGLFYAADEPYAASGGNPYGHNLFDTQAYLFIYKEGMQDKIKNYPPSKIIQIFKDMEKKKEDAYSANVTLPQKATPAQSPSQKAMMDAVKKRVADYSWKETPIYCYTTSEWLPQYQMLPNREGKYMRTLTSRIMAIVTVFKKPDGSCGFMKMQIEQMNSYSTGGDLKENYTTPPVDHANSGMDPIACEKANIYKPKQ
ncbi:hypothetical protein [Flavobacterium sp. RS13.1]|uniref:hypothetical protein n=1 Tax=Flavobacterium sp. RS13.1 TaxID=3400345 RepID=UPI003AAF2274